MVSPTTSRGGIFYCRLPYYTRRSAAGRFVGSGLDRSAGRQKIASLPYCVCRGDHWSPANLPPQRIFRDGFLARQTGTGEQCSPLQAFFGSSAEGSRPLPTEQKEKSASKETCPGEINPAPAHKRQSCNNGKVAGRACPAPTALQKTFQIPLTRPCFYDKLSLVKKAATGSRPSAHLEGLQKPRVIP